MYCMIILYNSIKMFRLWSQLCLQEALKFILLLWMKLWIYLHNLNLILDSQSLTSNILHMKRQWLSSPAVATHHAHSHFMYTQQTQMDRATVDNVNERACFRECMCVFVYTSTHVNMGSQLSVYDAGNSCWSPNIEIRHNILNLSVFKSLQ